MAKLSPNIPVLTAEAAFSIRVLQAPRPTPLETAFLALLEALDGFITAERAIDEVDAFDPAFADWLRDAELAHEQLTDSLYTLRQTPLRGNQDHRLHSEAQLINRLIGSEDPTDFRRLYHLIPRHEIRAFQYKDRGARARRVSLLLRISRAHIDGLATLACFGSVSPFHTQDALGENDPTAGQIAA